MRRSRLTPRHYPRFLSLLAFCTLLACEDRSFKADLQSQDTEKRVRAIEFLGTQRDRTSIPALVEAMGDPEVEVRSKAVWALGMMQAKEAVTGASRLLGDPESRVRQSVSRALMQIEEPDALPALRAALAKEADTWVRKDLEEAIAHLIQFEGETDVGESSFQGNYL